MLFARSTQDKRHRSAGILQYCLLQKKNLHVSRWSRSRLQVFLQFSPISQCVLWWKSLFLNEKNPVKVANRIVEENFSKQLNWNKQLFQRNAAQYHKKAVGELLVEEAENVDDANLGQRATAKNVARFDRSWYTIQAADLREKYYKQSAVIKGRLSKGCWS